MPDLTFGLSAEILRCAQARHEKIPSRRLSMAGVNVKIVVDHDQETGKPRGLLCDSCNTGLGRFKNGEDHIQSALDYLKGSN